MQDHEMFKLNKSTQAMLCLNITLVLCICVYFHLKSINLLFAGKALFFYALRLNKLIFHCLSMSILFTTVKNIIAMPVSPWR